MLVLEVRSGKYNTTPDFLGNFAGRLAEGGMVSVDYAPIHHDNGMLMGWTLLAHGVG